MSATQLCEQKGRRCAIHTCEQRAALLVSVERKEVAGGDLTADNRAAKITASDCQLAHPALLRPPCFLPHLSVSIASSSLPFATSHLGLSGSRLHLMSVSRIVGITVPAKSMVRQ